MTEHELYQLIVNMYSQHGQAVETGDLVDTTGLPYQQVHLLLKSLLLAEKIQVIDGLKSTGKNDYGEWHTIGSVIPLSAF